MSKVSRPFTLYRSRYFKKYRGFDILSWNNRSYEVAVLVIGGEITKTLNFYTS